MPLNWVRHMSYKDRVDTLRVVIGGSRVLAGSPKLNLIIGEVNRIAAADRVPRHNGWLLAVVHTTRALDTTLSEIIIFKAWQSGGRSLGSYLTALQSHRIISNAERQRYKQEIVDKRNKYMHEAGAMPSQLDANKILNEMHACLSTILGRPL